jgi:hypothetical protein
MNENEEILIKFLFALIFFIVCMPLVLYIVDKILNDKHLLNELILFSTLC